jgi:glutaconate CoA-transferase, subunit A
MRWNMNKVIGIVEAAGLIEDGITLAIGGNVLHRSPSAMVREIIRQNKRNLKIVKTAGAHDVDMLALGKCIQSVDAGFISYETEFGLAPFYRRSAQSGEIKVNEHACYTVMCALNAAKKNIPFMPVRGLVNSDLLKAHDYFKIILDPFSGEEITVVKAIKPDYAILHVQECDMDGNAFIKGPQYDDVLMAKAAKNVIITTEKIIAKAQLKLNYEKVAIPGILVKAVVLVQSGAKPCSCEGLYDIDRIKLKEFLKIEDNSEFTAFLKDYERMDHGKKITQKFS